MMTETLFAFSNDDAGMQEPELFAELLDFLDEQHVPATFFVVPSRRQAPVGPETGMARTAATRPRHAATIFSTTASTTIPALNLAFRPTFMLDILPPEVQSSLCSDAGTVHPTPQLHGAA